MSAQAELDRSAARLVGMALAQYGATTVTRTSGTGEVGMTVTNLKVDGREVLIHLTVQAEQVEAP